MKRIVVYRSKTGFTRKYAEWIAKQLQCDCVEDKSVTEANLRSYDVVIYGGGIMASQISGLKEMKTKIADPSKTKLVVFCTGATLAEEKEKVKEIEKMNFSEKDLEQIPFFYMQAGINYQKMSIPMRTLMKGFSKMLEKNQKKNGEMNGGMSLRETYDVSDEAYVFPLVELVNGLSN